MEDRTFEGKHIKDITTVLLISSQVRTIELWRHELTCTKIRTILVANQMPSALDIIKTQPIDAIISDIDIAPLDGWRLARLIRSGILSQNIDIPIILVAAIYCERLAETTARFYDVNHVIPSAYYTQIPHLIAAIESDVASKFQLPSLLVVSEKVDTGYTVERILANQFDISMSHQFDETLSLIADGEFDLVLLDYQFSEFCAKHLLQQIMRINENQSVVVMTTPGKVEQAEAMMMLGAVDFIRRPFKSSRLRKVCELAARREDFMLSNRQFADKVQALQNSKSKHKALSLAHKTLLEHLTTIIIELDENGIITYVNQAWHSLTGIDLIAARGNSLMSFVLKDDISECNIQQTIEAILQCKEEKASIECRIISYHNSEVWVDAKLGRLEKEDGSFGVTISMDNITERREAELKLQHIALHDPLTGLHNRHFFDQALSRFSSTQSNTQYSHVLLYVDLDHFKIINDTEGHHVGDVVLKQIASTLEQRIRSSDILCRIGGDEFAIILYNTAQEQAISIAQSLCEKVSQKPFQFGSNIYKLSCSIGMAEIDGSAALSHEYLKHADIALYVAKKRGRNMVHCYSESDQFSESYRNNLQWANKVQEALEFDKFILHFQPIIDTRSDEVAYFEALVRLDDNGRLVYPNQFIPALERPSDINSLDHCVVTKSIHMLAKHPCLNRISVNLSAHAFSDQRLLPLIANLISKTQIEASRLIFEITESASLSNLPATKALINQIRKLGCEFSIDDFGTGFSTFTYLKQLPAESVKIDGSFVRDILNDENDLSLVRAIHDVAQSLNKSSVAEFVESAEVYEAIKNIGIDYAQGFYLGKPMPIDMVEARFANTRKALNQKDHIKSIEFPYSKTAIERRNSSTPRKKQA
jgi:diguanylate cyclase (GGDEF)-like protein/PAS domain S-box-containing protein